MLADEIEIKTITLTASAVKAVQEMLTERKLDDHALRVYISGRSCSGFQYGLALEPNIREQDRVEETDGVRVVIDEISLPYLSGSKIDFIDGPDGSGFKIENPNEDSSCSGGSCGSSCC